ncbi:hypothetical protein A3735_14470 [Oleiphilus sp. HI0061]|nr:hypothetical protein A3735_14470 [Oleiphilus sp. HI0061]
MNRLGLEVVQDPVSRLVALHDGVWTTQLPCLMRDVRQRLQNTNAFGFVGQDHLLQLKVFVSRLITRTVFEIALKFYP